MAFEWMVIHKDGGSALETLISKKMPSQRPRGFCDFLFLEGCYQRCFRGDGVKFRTVQHANQWPDDDKCWRFAFKRITD